MFCINSISCHLEWLLTTAKNIFPMNSPVKSMWTVCHGVYGQSHGSKGACCSSSGSHYIAELLWLLLWQNSHLKWSEWCLWNYNVNSHSNQPSFTWLNTSENTMSILFPVWYAHQGSLLLCIVTLLTNFDLFLSLYELDWCLMAAVQFVANWWVWPHWLLCSCIDVWQVANAPLCDLAVFRVGITLFGPNNINGSRFVIHD